MVKRPRRAGLDRRARKVTLGGAYLVACSQQGAADDGPGVVRLFVARAPPPCLRQRRAPAAVAERGRIHGCHWPPDAPKSTAPKGACGLLIGSVSPADSAELRKPRRAVTTGGVHESWAVAVGR